MKMEPEDTVDSDLKERRELQFAMDALDSGAMSKNQIINILTLSRLLNIYPSTIKDTVVSCTTIVDRAFREER